MDVFMTHILTSLREHGSRAVRVFPASSQVLVAFAERIANEVVAEYIAPLLTRAREVSNEVYLQAAAASFTQVWQMVDALVQVAEGQIKKEQAEDVV